LSQPRRKTLFVPVIALLLLSPISAELLTCSSPPLSFFSPFGLTILVGLYGSGAIIVRECARRWGKGWTSIVLMGAAYGIIEEGLTAKSFFDPNWVDLGILGVYGRWLGVNWVWSEWLTIFHTTVSITAPIILAELMFPKEKDASWVGNRALAFFGVVFVAVVMIGFLWLTPFYPNIIQVAGCLAAVAILAYLAKRRPSKSVAGDQVRGRPLKFFALSLLMMFSFFLIFFAGPYFIAIPFVLMLIGGGAAFIFWRIYARWGASGLSDRQKFGVASGLLALWIALTPIQERNLSNPDNPAGMIYVGLAFLVYLVLLGRWVYRRTKQASIPPAPSQ